MKVPARRCPAMLNTAASLTPPRTTTRAMPAWGLRSQVGVPCGEGTAEILWWVEGMG